MAIGLVTSLALFLQGDGVATTFTMDTDKIPDRYYDSDSGPNPHPHYGKLTQVQFGGAYCNNSPFTATTSVAPGNKVVVVFQVPPPDHARCFGTMTMVFEP